MKDTTALRYKTLPTGTGFSNVLGSRARKLGRVCEKDAAQQKASSKACFRRKPPKIMKLWRLRSWGCMIIADLRMVSDMKTMLEGRWVGFWGSFHILSACLSLFFFFFRVAFGVRGREGGVLR